jgi:carboxylesterase type B
MNSCRYYVFIFLYCAFLMSAALSQESQLAPTAHWASTIAEKYLIYPDQTYGTANNYALKLDVWQRKGAKTPNPTLVYIHGGGWIFGDRTGATLMFLPYIEMGWNVVNVE